MLVIIMLVISPPESGPRQIASGQCPTSIYAGATPGNPLRALSPPVSALLPSRELGRLRSSWPTNGLEAGALLAALLLDFVESNNLFVVPVHLHIADAFIILV
jgi:hypothetical protein